MFVKQLDESDLCRVEPPRIAGGWGWGVRMRRVKVRRGSSGTTKRWHLVAVSENVDDVKHGRSFHGRNTGVHGHLLAPPAPTRPIIINMMEGFIQKQSPWTIFKKSYFNGKTTCKLPQPSWKRYSSWFARTDPIRSRSDAAQLSLTCVFFHLFQTSFDSFPSYL